MNHVDKRSGFTLVELMLAMTFVAILLIMIAITVIQISNIYNRGMTMRAVDQAGRIIKADMRMNISTSSPFDVETAFKEQTVIKGGSTLIQGARLCTGVVSYIWNNPADPSTTPINVFDTKSANPNDPDIKFVKVRDTGGAYCIRNNDKDKTYPVIAKNKSVELLADEGADLSIHEFTIKTLTESISTGQALYDIMLTIGTSDLNAIQTLDSSCKAPSEDGANQSFCSVNTFKFTAQAGNKGGV